MHWSKICIGAVSVIIIVFVALLMTGSPPLYEKHFSRKGLPVVGHPDQIVHDYGYWLLNGRTYGDGPRSNSFTSDGLCYVIVEVNGAKHKHMCHRVKTRFDRVAMTGTITFE